MSKSRNSSSSKKSPKKQIRGKKDKGMYVGIDLHKEFLQVATMDDDGKILQNIKVENTHESIRKHFTDIPIHANIVMESSSVWYGTYRFLTDKLGYKNVTLSNPYLTKVIAASKKKTDKIDAKILADLLRGGYIATCLCSKQKDSKTSPTGKIQKKTHSVENLSQKFCPWNFVAGGNQDTRSHVHCNIQQKTHLTR